MILGIDPGVSGAVAALTDGGRFCWVEDMPATDGWVNQKLLHDLFSQYEWSLAVVEKVRSMPKQGVASTFKFGHALGIALGVTHGIRLLHPSPGVWKRQMGLTGKSKGASRELAIQLWPEASQLLARKKDDGRAEALLLAEWGRRQT